MPFMETATFIQGRNSMAALARISTTATIFITREVLVFAGIASLSFQVDRAARFAPPTRSFTCTTQP